MNHLIVSGINFHSTPIAIRERFSIPASCLQYALQSLSGLPHVQESMVLSTCNRTEVYAVVTDVQAGLREIDSFFASTQAIAGHEALRPDFKLLHEDTALHLFRVASGMDSMILAEGQIMSQVKAAYQAAQDAGTTGIFLDQLCKLALNCGKRVRSETSIGRRAVSISTAALELARSIIGPLKDRQVVVIGAGRMAQICVKHLLNEAGNGQVILINRSQDRVERFLKNEFPNRGRLQTGFDFADRYKLAGSADLVIVSTTSPEYIVLKQELATCKTSDDVCIIDISVPRNVEPSVSEVRGVKLFSVDDLALIVDRNLAERESMVGEAEKIVMESLEEFQSWQRSLFVVPTIVDLREKIESIRIEQVEKGQTACSAIGPELTCKYLEEISRAIVNQILHHPTVQLKATRDYENLSRQAEALRTLFNLDRSDSSSNKQALRCRSPKPCQTKRK